MKMGFVYRISAPNSDCIYVGQSRNPETRWKQHIAYARRGVHENPRMQKFLTKHTDAIMLYWPVLDMSASEIDYERTQRESGFDLMNLIPCGTMPPSHAGRKRSQETRARMASVRIGKPHPTTGGWKHSPETLAKLSEQRMGRTPWNKGKRLPSHPGYTLGFKHSPESRAKLSESLRRLWMSRWAKRRVA